jgi:hypothetical protein
MIALVSYNANKVFVIERVKSVTIPMIVLVKLTPNESAMIDLVPTPVPLTENKGKINGSKKCHV